MIPDRTVVLDRVPRILVAAAGALTVLASCKSASTVETGTQRSQGSLATKARTGPDAPRSDSIGIAEMTGDRTIVLNLRASVDRAGSGEARLVYPPSHPQYREILEHLGGMKPGETKPVPPWP
jgi:hypothetical protein